MMYGVAVKCSDGWQTNIKEILVGFISYQDANDYALEMNNQVEDEIQDDNDYQNDWSTYYEVVKVRSFENTK